MWEGLDKVQKERAPMNEGWLGGPEVTKVGSQICSLESALLASGQSGREEAGDWQGRLTQQSKGEMLAWAGR